MAISQWAMNIISFARLHRLNNVPAHRPMCSIHPDCHGWGAHHPFSCRGARKWLRHNRLRLGPWEQLLQPSNCLPPSSIRLKMGCAIVMAILWVVWSSGLLFDDTNEYYLTFVLCHQKFRWQLDGSNNCRCITVPLVGSAASFVQETGWLLADLSLWMEAVEKFPWAAM
jgi:hypothetical protein